MPSLIKSMMGHLQDVMLRSDTLSPSKDHWEVDGIFAFCYKVSNGTLAWSTIPVISDSREVVCHRARGSRGTVGPVWMTSTHRTHTMLTDESVVMLQLEYPRGTRCIVCFEDVKP